MKELPKQEWSEQDNKNLKECVIAISMSEGHTLEEKEQLKDWIKKRLSQKQWKPSDKQMNTLEQWLKDNQYKGDARYCYPIFESLYQDLKKLKE